MFRSCILEDDLCNWSYGTCTHANISRKKDELDLCLKRKSTVHISDCQCDRGYEIQKVKKGFIILIENHLIVFFKNTNGISCVVRSNRTIDMMLNPRASFSLNQHGSVFAVSFIIEFIV